MMIIVFCFVLGRFSSRVGVFRGCGIMLGVGGVVMWFCF